MPTPSLSNRLKHPNSRRRSLIALSVLLVGAVTCIAGMAGAAQLREASPIDDGTSQARVARADIKPGDGSPPSMPRRLRLATATPTSVTLSWSRSRDNIGVAHYEALVGRLTIRTRRTTHTVASLECSTTYKAGVTAVDAAGNRSRTAWISVSTVACAPPPPPTDPQPPAPTPPPPPPAVGNILPDYTFSWDDFTGSSAGWGRLYMGQRATGTANRGTCPAAGTSLVPWQEVVQKTAAGKRFVQDTLGAQLTALSDAADMSNCNALRSEFSFPKAAPIAQTDGDEAWYGWSLKWPLSNPYDNGFDMMGFADTGSHVQHPSYGGSANFGQGGGTYRVNIRAGHYPSPTATQPDGKGHAGCPNDWQPINAATCPTAANRNGVAKTIALLGTGAPKPWTQGVWHDFIIHQVLKARENGVLRIYHRLEGGSWDLLYSNVPGDNARIQDSPAPTLQWNQQYGAPGENGTERSGFYFQLYRNKPSPTRQIYLSGIRRRGSLDAIKAEFMGELPTPPPPPPPATPPPAPPPGDLQPPSMPSNPRVASATTTSIGLTWTASTDDVGVPGYDVYLNGVKAWTTTGTSFTYLGLSCGRTYTGTVQGYDAAGNRSRQAQLTTATAPCSSPPPASRLEG